LSQSTYKNRNKVKNRTTHIGNDGIECVRTEETTDDMYRPQRALIGIFIQYPDNEVDVYKDFPFLKQTVTILEFYFRFRFDLFIGMLL